jgi:hypothetical protein
MTVPIRSDTTIVRGRTCIVVVGRSNPSAENRPCRPFASRSPTPSPTIEATTPMMTDSTSTETSTCRLVAPIARYRPISRVRCVTMMLKVLKMMNAPTNRDTNANTRSAVRRKPSACAVSSACCAATSVAVTASNPFGSTLSIRSASAVSVTPESATT